MKTNALLLASILWGGLFLFAGCEAGNNHEPEPVLTEQLAFVVSTRDGDDDLDATDFYGNPYSDRNLARVPDAVGVFVNKSSTEGGPTTPVMANAIYRLSEYPSTITDSYGDTLFWYKTSHRAAYWDMTSFFNIYAYAPVAEGGNNYYTVSDAGVVTFEMDSQVGIPVDFIYAPEEGKKENKAESLHMPFEHKLCKIVFRLKNGTDNVVVCNGIKYSIQYPKATFNLIKDEWTFLNSSNKVTIQLEEQYQIFGSGEYWLPGLTTLLFPTDAPNLNLVEGVQPSDVIVDFEVILNNIPYSVKEDLAELGLEYKEGKLIVLTFDCRLKQGSDYEEGVLRWNIYSATFDSFEYGGSFEGRLE